MLRSLLLTLIYLLPFLLSAQRNPIPFQEELVYPVRKDHKVGYLYIKDDYSTICPTLPAKFDYIGENPIPWNTTSSKLVESSFRLFSIDEKVGLINENMLEVVPNHYKRIRPVSENYFAVEKDSLFVLIDRAGNVVDSTRYQNICAADPPYLNPLKYLFVQKDNRWGLKSLDGNMLLECKYADISSAGKVGFYKIRESFSDDYWKLINTKGEKILPTQLNRTIYPESYKDIVVMDEDFIGVKYINNYWDFFRRNKKNKDSKMRFFERGYSQLWKLNDTVAAFIDTLDVVLYHINDQRTLKSDLIKRMDNGDFYPRYQHLDDRASIRLEGQGRRTIINNKGEQLSDFYKEIDKTGQPYFYKTKTTVTSGFQSGFFYSLLCYTADSMEVLASEKREIFPPQYNMILTYSQRSYGVIAVEGNSVVAELPEDYSNVTIMNKNEVTAQLNNQSLRFVLDREKGEFKQDLILDAQNVSINKIPKHIEAEVVSLRKFQTSRPKFVKDHYDRLELEAKQEEGKEEYELIIKGVFVTELDDGKTKTKKVNHLKLKSKEKYNVAKEISSDFIALYHERDLGNMTQFDREVLTYKPKWIELAKVKEKKIIPNKKYIGIRKFSSDNATTAFIDTNGKMGLMDQKGNEIKKGNQPLRFTYIAPFVDGKAAACIGGKLFLHKKIKSIQGFKMMPKQNFVQQFNIKQKRSKHLDAYPNEDLYFIPDDDVQWMYIDSEGKILFKVEAGMAHDFQESNHTALIEVRDKVSEKGKVATLPRRKRGLIDFRGNTIIKPEYNSIERYTEFYVVSKRGTPTFSFNEKGHQIYKNRTRIRPFSENISVFKNEKEQWGYLDNTGQIIIEPQYVLARPFSEGKALAKAPDGQLKFINTEGETVFNTGLTNINQWRTIGDFKDGRCWFKEKGKKPRWGAYDVKGNIIIEPKFYYVPTKSMDVERVQELPMDFSNGVAAVQVIVGNGTYRAGIIDTLGKWVKEPSDIEIINRFDHYGFATFKKTKKSRLVGLMDKKGNVVVEPKYAYIEGFVNGHARVRNSNKDWGIINQNGKEVIPLKYLNVDTVAQGLVAVQLGKNKWQFVDLNNKVAIRGPFSETQEFVNGITMVLEGERKKVINRKGEEIRMRFGRPLFVSDGIIGVETLVNGELAYYYADASGSNLYGRYFDEISPFNMSSSSIKQKSKVYQSDKYYGAINKRGISIVPPKFKMLHLQPDGTIIINPQEYKGLVSPTGQVILPVIYDQVIPVQSRTLEREGNGIIFRVEIGEAIGYFRVKDNVAEEIWELQK